MTENRQVEPAANEPSLAAGQPLTRVCRRCSVQSQVIGDFCPSCGKPFIGRSGPSKKTLIVAAAFILVLVGGGVTAMLVKHHNDDVAADRRANATALAEKKAEEAAAAEDAERQAAADAKAAKDAAERKERRSQVRYLERTITKDARKDVNKGLLDGPVFHTSCTATGGGSTDDLTALTGTFQCLAVTEKHSDGTESGYGYAATVDWQSGRITWQLGG